MWSSKREVEAGDTVIIWLTRDNLYPLLIDPKAKDLNTKFGNFRHTDLIGVPYGSKIAAKHTGKSASRPSTPAPRGFIHILRPTPELWTLALPHRTQILYLADIAFICSWLGIKPGSRVVEAGTGSGSFSHSVARVVGGGSKSGCGGEGKEGGHLFSYEFHEARFLKAKEEFARHGMSDVITIQHRNVCKDGFTNVDEIDAVFLDLPAPWEAIEHAKKALRKDRPARICCFSPCIEQVLRTVTALNAAGFTEITMHEVLLRPIEVFQTPPLPSIAGLAEKLKKQEVRREEKRVRQVEQNRVMREREREKKRKAGEVEEGSEGGEGKEGEAEGKEEGSSTKRVKVDADEEAGDADETAEFAIREEDMVELLDEEDVEEGDMEVDSPIPSTPSALPTTKATTTSTSTSTPAAISITANSNSSAPVSASAPVDASTIPQPSTATAARRLLRTLDADSAKINVSKALPEVRGHTSYLTFACLVPRPGWKAAQAEVPAAVVQEEGVDVEGEKAEGVNGVSVNWENGTVNGALEA